VSFDRGLVLFQQRRFGAAAEQFREALATNPDSAEGHSMLALCLLEQEKFAEATREARHAVELAPDHAMALSVLARVYYVRNYLKEADETVRQAIQLEPEDPHHHGLLAAIRLNAKDWTGSLGSAEDALRIDPENSEANNIRAMALVRLGRRDEAGMTIGATLAREPEDALTHANQGWALLHANEPKKAMEHFREALRLDPEMDWARQGIVEALKAKNPVYRLMLMYFLWMSRLSAGAQWGLIVGGWLGSRFLRTLARNNPEFGPFVWPIIVLYVVFVVLCWTAAPLFNLLLRLNKFGRLVLSDEERVASNWFGGTILLAVALLVAGGVLVQLKIVITGFIAALMIIPVAGIYQCPKGWPRNVMGGYTVALAGLGLLTVVLLDVSSGKPEPEGPAAAVGGIFFLALFLSTWLANVLMQQQPKR
jgi:Flp pilus assembly protein TadD